MRSEAAPLALTLEAVETPLGGFLLVADEDGNLRAADFADCESPCEGCGIGGSNANPFRIAVPCHRLVGASGGLTGYSGGVERLGFVFSACMSKVAHAASSTHYPSGRCKKPLCQPRP
jgi:hypothetical protein